MKNAKQFLREQGIPIEVNKSSYRNWFRLYVAKSYYAKGNKRQISRVIKAVAREVYELEKFSEREDKKLRESNTDSYIIRL